MDLRGANTHIHIYIYICARVLLIAGHYRRCITELRSHNKDKQRRFEMALNLDDTGGIPDIRCVGKSVKFPDLI